MSLSKDTVFYSLANWGRRLVGFVTAPILIAYLDPGDYGYMALVNTLGTFCSILGMMAIVDQGLARFFIDAKEDHEKQGYVTTSYFAGGTGVAVVALLIMGGTPAVRFFLHDVQSPWILTALVALVCVTQSFQYVGSNMLKWTFQSPLFMRITLLQTLAGAALTVAVVVLFGWRGKGVILVGAAAALGAGLWANWSVRDYVRPSAFSRDKLRHLVSYSWPLLGLNIFAYFTRSLDRIFLAGLASLGAVGVFSVAYTIGSLFETLVSGFFFAWSPYLFSTFKEDWAPRRYAHFFSAFACFGLLSLIGLGLWGGPVVMVFRPDGAYRQIGVFIPWIVGGILHYYLGGYFAPGPAITKKTHWKLFGFILAASANALLNYLLIPRLGILGAGMATTLSSLLAGTFNQIVSNRLYFVPNRWRVSFLLIVLFTAAVSFIQYDAFPYHLPEMTFVDRTLVTLVLMGLALLPFQRDIRRSGLVGELIGKVLKRA